MPLLNWDSSFSVGVEEIDKQHQKLFALINQLHDAMMCGKENEVLESVLSSVADYTEYHFSFEEELMDKFDYPDSEKHKMAHTKLKETLSEIQAEYPKAKPGANMRAMDFLQSWLINHIVTGDMDMKLGAYISSKS